MSGIAIAVATSGVSAAPPASVVLTATVSVSSTQVVSGASGDTSAHFSASATGGTPPYTYLWQEDSQQPNDPKLSLSSPNSASTTVHWASANIGTDMEISPYCTVADSVGGGDQSGTLQMTVRRGS